MFKRVAARMISLFSAVFYCFLLFFAVICCYLLFFAVIFASLEELT